MVVRSTRRRKDRRTNGSSVTASAPWHVHLLRILFSRHLTVALCTCTLLCFDYTRRVQLLSIKQTLAAYNFDHVHTAEDEDDDGPRWVIFYNIFLPEKPTLYRHALRVLEDQMDQVGASYAAHAAVTSTTRERKLVLYYNTIGRKLPDSYMNFLCSIRNDFYCIHNQHFSVPVFEEETLKQLHSYCTGHPDNTVIYIHSKGSYHTNTENEFWRRHLTRAVTSEDCLERRRPQESSPLSSCNVCGLNFYPVWTMFFPGNFWTADCSYVQDLLPPDEFRMRMQEFIDQIVSPLLRSNSDVQATLYEFENNPGNTGIGRYAAEHWIANHPNVKPCDVSKTPDIMYWRTQAKHDGSSMTRLALAPRYSWNTTLSWYRWNRTLVEALLHDKESARKEYFLLRGLLMRMQFLYGKVPPVDSWIWKWFPDKDLWPVDEISGPVAATP